MNNFKIERNSLDFILTDSLPYELPELFSLYPFYEFLIERNKDLNEIKQEILREKEKNNYLFDGQWSTTPLKFKILKGNYEQRTMSLLNPLSILNLYFFIEVFQKELLILLKKNNDFSLRYHTKNSSLYYKGKSKSSVEYFYKNKRINKSILQQTGIFYKILKYNSINEFTSSKEWNLLNFKYKNYCSIDYKACFDSIYSHSFKWIITKDVIDSKKSNSSNLFVNIDRIAQNINSKSSNGLPVGPEFSRMIAELLLQEIDNLVKLDLQRINIIHHIDYDIFRYVDDIFIFANSDQIIDKIINTYRNVASDFNLNINELKIFRRTTPFINSLWISKTRKLSDSISNIFNKTNKLNTSEDETSLLKNGYLQFDRIMDEIKIIICEYPESKKQIVSYLLSTIYNQVSKKNKSISIFNTKNTNKALLLIELCFYIFSYHTTYDHAQKLLSIIALISSEVDLINIENLNNNFQKIINNYSFIFEVDTISDITNLLIMLNEYKLNLPVSIEKQLENRIIKERNPLHLAVFLIYAQYNRKYSSYIKNIIEDNIKHALDELTHCQEILLNSEFWFILIFINCNLLDESIKSKMRKFISNIITTYTGDSSSAKKATILVCEFINQRKQNLFFTWGYSKFSLTNQIAFKTYQRTIFKNYRRSKQLGLETS